MDASKDGKTTEAMWKSAGKSPGGNPAENYERFFVPVIGAPVASDLMESAALRPGERVLDIACGTGVVTRLAAGCVGPSGTVVGLDISPVMLEVARSATAPDTSIEWREASAEAIPLPDESFDAVLCGLGLQFVPDKAAALREMRRVLVPEGRLLLNLPGAMPPLFAAAHEPLERHLGPQAAGFLRMVFSLHAPDELRSLLEAAEFRDVSLRQEAKTFSLPAPSDFFWQYILSTPIGAATAQASEATRADLEREVVEKWQEFSSEGGMEYRQDVITATGLK